MRQTNQISFLFSATISAGGRSVFMDRKKFAHRISIVWLAPGGQHARIDWDRQLSPGERHCHRRNSLAKSRLPHGSDWQVGARPLRYFRLAPRPGLRSFFRLPLPVAGAHALSESCVAQRIGSPCYRASKPFLGQALPTPSRSGTRPVVLVNATIGYALGLPLDQILYSPTKRPFTVASKGAPITKLFSS